MRKMTKEQYIKSLLGGIREDRWLAARDRKNGYSGRQHIERANRRIQMIRKVTKGIYSHKNSFCG